MIWTTREMGRLFNICQPGGAVERVIGFFFPEDIYCAACGNLIDSTRPYALCDKCVREIKWHTGATCAVCGKSLAPHRTGGICGECRELGRSFDVGMSCCEYTGRARDLVRVMKYGNAAWIASKLAEVMYDRWRQLASGRGAAGGGRAAWLPASGGGAAGSRYADGVLPSIVAPVPMTAAKRRLRGYDQAEVLARRLACLIGAPFTDDLLRRKRNTAVMSDLSAHDRRANMIDAFEAGQYFREQAGEDGDGVPADVMLVDDVFTTGSTADACAVTLKRAGVREVTLFTFASGPDMDVTY
jgi:predicted amidophosphoribosyltransferase